MLISLLLGVVGARAACPSVELHLERAQEDTLAYFLADAEASMEQAVAGMGCSTIDRATLVRFWLVRATLWSFSEDPRAEEALAAAKALDPEFFIDDLGPELRAAWERTDPAPLAPSTPIQIRGLRKGDAVWVDLEEVDPPTSPPGLHLVQVLRNGTPIGARVVRADPEDVVQINLLGPGGSKVGDHGGRLDYTLAVPLELRGRKVVDGAGETLDYRLDVLPAVLLVEEGRSVWLRRRRAGRRQWVAAGLTALCGYGTYLAGYRLTTGGDPGVAILAGGLGVATSVAFTWEIRLARERRLLKRRAVELAEAAFRD